MTAFFVLLGVAAAAAILVLIFVAGFKLSEIVSDFTGVEWLGFMAYFVWVVTVVLGTPLALMAGAA